MVKWRDTRYAHRLAWELANGPIPDGLLILHKCDNPVCCNPDHLFLGTAADNHADCAAKGRAAFQRKCRAT
ncbi:MAG: HNH endonuclease signature motif containing protein [Caulobacteraceae bacterium]